MIACSLTGISGFSPHVRSFVDFPALLANTLTLWAQIDIPSRERMASFAMRHCQSLLRSSLAGNGVISRGRFLTKRFEMSMCLHMTAPAQEADVALLVVRCIAVNVVSLRFIRPTLDAGVGTRIHPQRSATTQRCRYGIALPCPMPLSCPHSLGDMIRSLLVPLFGHRAPSLSGESINHSGI